MSLRARLILLIAALAVLAVAASTCTSEDRELRDVRRDASASDRPAGDEERPERRRVARASRAADEVGEVRGVAEPVVSSEPEHSDAAEVGHVRATVLGSDGRPLAGARVCAYPAEMYVPPRPWDGVTSSDGAYFDLAFDKGLWPHFDPVLGSAQSVRSHWNGRDVTDAAGRVTLDVAEGQPLVLFVKKGEAGYPLVRHSRVELAAGEELELTLETARVRVVTGRCVDADGEPLAGIAVQAVSPLEERPVSAMALTTVEGVFVLGVVGDDSEVRLRATASHPTRTRGIFRSEESVPPVPADTTVVGVVPGVAPVDIRMTPAPLVFIELTAAGWPVGLVHLQVEGLAFDPRMSAWGRLGGPQYRRGRSVKSARAVIGLTRDEASRPLMLWSWGWTITAVDPRGRDRVAVEIPRGRRAGVHVLGGRSGDRLRVVAFCGPAGDELACVWIDAPLGGTAHWARDDSPVAEIEFQIVRDGVIVGRSARVPAGTEAATDVQLDVR